MLLQGVTKGVERRDIECFDSNNHSIIQNIPKNSLRNYFGENALVEGSKCICMTKTMIKISGIRL